MQRSNDALIAALEPVVSRVVTSHCWVKRGAKISHLRKSLTRERLAHHLNGGPYVGAATIAPGSRTMRIAVLDLDSHKGETPWPAMQAAALTVMRELERRGFAPVPFRSSGGAGIHLYLIWQHEQDAYSVRQALRAALAELGYSDGPGGVAAGRIEVFPKQSHVPADGFGNMFVLPLADKSVPLDAYELEDMSKDAASWPVSAAVPVVEPEAPSAPPAVEMPVELETLRAPPAVGMPVELETLRAALEAIPNKGEDELEYDAWRNVVFGVHHATSGSDAGLALAHEFSARAAKYDPVFLDTRVWPYIGKSSEMTPITARSILHLAREYGWEEPLEDEFEALPAESPRPNSFRLGFERAQAPIKPDLIQGVIPDAELGVIFGPSGSGKSFAAIDLGFHLARGVPWRGRKTKQRPVFYVAAEGAIGVRKRTKAYALFHELAPDSQLPFYTRESAINLWEKNGWVKAAEDILALTEGSPGVIVIDTLSRCMVGVDENSAKDMSRVVKHCQDLARATNCLVLVVAHAGKDESKGARGSSALKAAADFEIAVSRLLETPQRFLKVTKAKDDTDGIEFGFVLEAIQIGHDTDGDAVSSAVAVPSELRRENVAVERPRSITAARALDAYFELSEFSEDRWVDVEKIVDRVLENHADASKNARYNVRRWINGPNKLEIFDVFDGKVRSSIPQTSSEDSLRNEE